MAFVRKICGGSQAILVSTDDGLTYVVKSPGNPQGTRTLINEWIGFRVLERLGISVARQSGIHLGAEFIINNQGMWFECSGGTKWAMNPGVHLGCEMVNSGASVVYDFLPKKFIPLVNNLQHFLGVLLVDKWLANEDRRQCVFFRVAGKGSFKATMIDHGQIFGGNRWALSDTPLMGRHHENAVYDGARSLSDFEPWLDRLEECDDKFFHGVVDELPSDWLGSDRDDLLQLVERLLRRRVDIPRMIREIAECSERPFENWGERRRGPAKQAGSILQKGRLAV